MPQVNGLDPTVATVTRTVAGTELRYTITPLNVPSGYTAYILVGGQCFTEFNNVPVNPQNYLDVNIICSKLPPTQWWKFQHFDGVVNPSAEYTLRETANKHGHQFSIETGLLTN